MDKVHCEVIEADATMVALITNVSNGMHHLNSTILYFLILSRKGRLYPNVDIGLFAGFDTGCGAVLFLTILPTAMSGSPKSTSGSKSQSLSVPSGDFEVVASGFKPSFSAECRFFMWRLRRSLFLKCLLQSPT